MSRRPISDAPGQRPALRLAIVAASALGLILAHYLTPTASHVPHDIYDRLLYIPIILAGFWFGLGGGLLTSALVTCAYFPHILRDLGGDPLGLNLSRTLEATVWNTVALVTGTLSQSLRRERDRLAGLAEEQRQTLEDLRRADAALREKTRQIFEAEEQLRQADRLAVLGKLSAGLAHEIRNPLGAIRGASEILADKIAPGEPEREFLDILQREVGRLNSALTNYLEFARGDARAAGGEAGTCRLDEAVDTVLGLLGHEIERRGVRVERTGAAQTVSVALPRDQLCQVLLNLVLNALQSLPGAGVVALRAEAGAGTATLAVGDSGPGVPEAMREKIFQPFVTTRAEGTGLGLAIVAKILQSHGASVTVGRSALGGAEFTLHLPVAG